MTSLAQHQSRSNEHYTPPVYIEAARSVMGSIDLDPASCETANATVQAEGFFAKTHNGLNRDWWGHVWLNPPYGKTGSKSNAGIWVSKLFAEWSAGRVRQAIYLVHANTAQRWFANCWRYPLCFVDHRIQFLDEDGNPQQNQPGAHVFGYVGHRPDCFGGVFRRFGKIVPGAL